MPNLVRNSSAIWIRSGRIRTQHLVNLLQRDPLGAGFDILFRPGVEVSERHMCTTVLGEPVSMPILIAPTSFQGLAPLEGEVATVKATGAAKTLMTLSTLSTFSIEEIMAVATGPVWFQLYVFKDRAISASLVKRTEAAGCKAIVLTVDVPLLGRRERDVRDQFRLPDDNSLKHLLPTD